MKVLRSSEVVFYGSPLEASLFESFLEECEEKNWWAFLVPLGFQLPGRSVTYSVGKEKPSRIVVIGSRLDIPWHLLMWDVLVARSKAFVFARWSLREVSGGYLFKLWMLSSLEKILLPLAQAFVFARTFLILSLTLIRRFLIN